MYQHLRSAAVTPLGGQASGRSGFRVPLRPPVNPIIRVTEEMVVAYQATVIPIMIASPGDVSEERTIIREVIHDWNDVNSVVNKLILTAVGWETHASPEMGERPQEIINSRLLKECDLLVGVFWTRFGTPTGDANSGTEEEIERHVAAGKPAMLYFSSRPVALESVDLEQYKAVQAFRDKCKKTGLIQEYNDPQEFRKKFGKHLQTFLNTNQYIRDILEEVVADTPFDVADQAPVKQTIKLSEEEAALLKAAASSPDGHIYIMRHLGGASIQAGNKSFGAKIGREFVKWEAALQSLEAYGLVVARGFKGEVYELTHQGWSAADQL